MHNPAAFLNDFRALAGKPNSNPFGSARGSRNGHLSHNQSISGAGKSAAKRIMHYNKRRGDGSSPDLPLGFKGSNVMNRRRQQQGASQNVRHTLDLSEGEAALGAPG